MIRFVDIIARTLPTSRLKAMAQAMLANEDEEYLLIERCANMKTIDQCQRISPKRQRDIMSILNTKVQLWVLTELDKNEQGFFSRREQEALFKALKNQSTKRK